MLADPGFNYSNILMSSNAPARKGDKEHCLENLPKAMDFIRENLESGPVLIHFRSGKDRTGMAMATYLIEFENFYVEKSIQEVIAVRPIDFNAEGWMEFGLDLLHHFKTLNFGSSDEH